MATIATHNGTSVSRQHNLRNPKVVSKEDHIDPKGHFEVWVDERPQDAYKRLFGDAVQKYNDKQKRSDRKIDDYYHKICQDKKKHPVYEMIVGVYDKNIPAETKKEILKEFVDGWNERNPNLELIGAYFHADELGEEHLHADYIPVVRNCSRGLETQTALVKALEQQGIVQGKSMKETAQILWEARENQHLENLCKSRGIEVEHPQKGGQKVRHLETDIYKLTAEIQTLEQRVDTLKKDVVEWTAEKDLTSLEAKEMQKRIEEVKVQIDEIEKSFFLNLGLLDRFRFFIKGHDQMNPTLKNYILDVVDAFEKWETRQLEKMKSLTSKKEKTNTVIKEKRKGIDDVSR